MEHIPGIPWASAIALLRSKTIDILIRINDLFSKAIGLLNKNNEVLDQRVIRQCETNQRVT